MSDEKVSLEFLGEQMLRMQADLREVRSEQLQMRSEQVKLESEQTSMRADFRRLEGKFDEVGADVKAMDASNQMQFEQIRHTMALSLEITLEAVKAGRDE